jgi:hypothetical protein
MSDDNLVGYLLNALDTDTQREIESLVRSDPDARQRLELLRRALEPLAADRDDIEPPSGLRMRTLARVAEYRCRRLPYAPPAPPVRAHVPARSWWRRADVLVAASLLLVVLPIIPPALTYLRHHRNISYCQNNLRGLYQALMAYSEHHSGDLPKVEDAPPRDFAGVFVPLLRNDNVLGPAISVACPANGSHAPPPVTMETLQMERVSQPELFAEHVRQMGGCYAYTLGHRDGDGRLCGVHYDPSMEWLPILADRPPFEQQGGFDWQTGNSPNHAGKGQNVLFLGGHVVFWPGRNAGLYGDDIYLNKAGRPEAGMDGADTVLGASEFRPSLPPPEPWHDR